MKKDKKELWVIVNRKTKQVFTFTMFSPFKQLCKELIDEGKDKLYMAQYHKGGCLVEEVKLTDYFGV